MLYETSCSLLLLSVWTQLICESLTDKFCQYLKQFTLTWQFCQIFADSSLTAKCSTEGAVLCSFRRALLIHLLWEILPDAFCQHLEKITATIHLSWSFGGRRLSTRCSSKGAAHGTFCRALWTNYFEGVFLKEFASTWNNLLNHCTSAQILLIKALVQSALRKELSIAPFEERLKTATLVIPSDQLCW